MKTSEHSIELKRVYEQFDSAGVLLSGPDTVTYFTGIEFPGANSFPERPIVCFLSAADSAVVICPFEWSAAVKDQGWKGQLIAYGDTEREPFKVIAETLSEYCTKSVTYESETIPYELFSQLETLCPGLDWIGGDEQIQSLRMHKSESEAELMRTAAEQLEFGLIGAIQHLEGSLEENGYTCAEFCERIRVHVYETGGTASGLSAVAAGRGLQQWYDNPAGKFIPGEMVRIEATSRYFGYWANTARMMVIGEAKELQQRAYRENLLLKQTAVSMLNPGVRSSAIFEEVVELAAEKGIDVRSDYGVGHGLGTSEREAPFLAPGDDTILITGMCIVVAVYTEGPQKELLCVKDTYLLSEQGPVCLSSFHNWDELYEINGFRSAH